ncbi:hypothetical protein ACLB2K_045521 [Fragaria x ananassa]
MVTEVPIKEQLESSDDFEFEIASGALNPHLESVLIQMSVGQSACFIMDLPPREFIFAAADDSTRMLSLLSSKTCCLEYTIRLLQSIRESCATTLVDFGCGSGSLLDSLLNYPTSLEKISGVDLSQKSLTSAAKILNSKLNSTSDVVISSTCLKSAILYDGSVTDSDSRLCGFDIGTCLEVIEHMEEDQAYLFGNVAPSYFRPKILIVSTPNHEYNVILQKSTLSTPEDDLDERVNHNLVSFVTMTISLSGREHSSIAGQLNWPQGTTTVLSSVGLVDLVMNQVLLPRLLSLDGEPYLRKIILKNSQIQNIITKLLTQSIKLH